MSDAGARHPPPPRRRARRVLVAVGVLLLAFVFLIAIVLAALRSAGGRRALLDRAVDSVRAATGLEIAASDAAFDVRRRSVVLERVTIAAAGAKDRPFLTLDRVVAVLDPASLARRRPLRIVELDARGARLDLSAPLPATAAAVPEAEPTAPPPIEIDRFLLDGFSVSGVALPPAAARLGEVRLEDLRAAGSLHGGRIELAIDRGELVVTGQAPAQGLRASVAGRVAGALQGPFAVDDLRLAGDGIAAEAAGVLGLSADEPLRLRATVDAAPGLLFPEVGSGRLTLTADLDLREIAGTIDARATAFPAELLAPALGAEVFTSLGAAGTLFDGDTALRLAGRDRVTGTAHLVWRDAAGDQPLLVADLETAAPLVVDVDARLVPGWSGRRTVLARVRLPAWSRIAEAEIVTSRAEVATPDLERALAEVESRFPALLPVFNAPLPIAGPLTMTATARGSVLDPELELDAEWRPQPQTSVVLRGGGRPFRDGGAGRRMSGRAVIEELDLATIEPLRDTVAAGSASGVVDLDLEGDAVRAHVSASARDLLLAPDRRVDALELEALVTPRVVRIVRAELSAGEARVEASGALDLDLESARPLVAATLDATLTRPVEGIERVSARLALARGTLEVDVPAAVTDYGTVRGRLVLPLAGLAAVPALEAAMAELPTPTATGPVELTLAAPALEAADLLRRLGIEGPDLLRGDVDLSLAGDLKVPAASAGVLTVRGLAIADEGAAIEARDEAITLRLDLGRLTLDPVTIAVRREPSVEESAAGGAASPVELEVAASVDLARAWKLGDPIADLVGPLRVDATARELDGAALFAALGIEPPFERLSVTGAELHLALDPSDPTAATGSLDVGALDAVLEESHSLRLLRPLDLRLADRALRLAPASVEIDGQVLTVAGGVRFDPQWRPGDPVNDLVAAIDASLRGVLEAEALSPYLAGASASGRLAVDVAMSGTLDQLAGHALLEPAEGGAEIVLLDPYYTRLSDPRVELAIEEGTVTIVSATAALNEGELDIAGTAVPSEGTLDLRANLEDVRYRLDYGLLTEGDAWLFLKRTESGALRLDGRIWLERGFLRRDLDPDREVLSYLFAPEEVDAPSALDDLELDLELVTVDGVRIHNNLADLRATWSPLEITGTLAAPLVEGSIDLDPGGYLFAYGQTVRVDSGSIDFAGDGSPPTIDLETATSWEDPTVAQVAPGGRTYLDSLRRPASDEEAEASVDEAIARGFAGYYGERLASRLSESLGGVEVSLRPILVFGLDNPGTEITVSRDLSAHVTAAVSVSLREEGSQTYVAEIHEIDTLPSFIGQLYTLKDETAGVTRGDAERAEGVVAQQRLLFGGSPVDEGGGPRLRRLVLDAEPNVVSKRAIRRRLGVEQGRRLAEGAAFEAQIEVLELLRRRGYPGADVEVSVEPVAAGTGRAEERADLRISIVPGQRVDFEFRGVELHRRQRALITAIYRPDFLEPVSLDEMREQTTRELHAAGYLDPEVTIDVHPRDDGSRIVTIDAHASERVRPAAPLIEGIDEDAAAAIAARFVTTLSRVELALGEPVAERRLTTALAEYGYPDGRVESRRLETTEAPADGGRQRAGEARAARPVIAVVATARQYVAGVEIVSRPEADAHDETTVLDGIAELMELEPVRALTGEPVRADRISLGAFAIEDALQASGHARARVRSQLLPAPGGGSGRVLRYEVDRADLYRVAGVRFEGLRSTSSGWAQQVAELDSGAPLDPATVREARRRLYQTGLFSSVLPEIDYRGGVEDATADAAVTFVVRERPRFELAYGVLWQSDLGASAVIDAVDQNLLGRGITLGARARYRSDDRSARIYSALPGVFGTHGSLQLFTEYLELEDQDANFLVDTQAFEVNLAASMPLRPQLTARLYGRYLDITDTLTDADPLFPLPPFDITFAYPSFGFQAVYEGRDDPVATQRGTFASIDLSGADETLGSDFSYARLFARASHHRGLSLLARPVLWAQSARLGLGRAFRDQQLISFEHMFAGGEYSIRGYDEEAIGPSIFELVEEQALLVLNEELHLPVWRDLLTGVLFVDAGNVWQDWGRLGDDFLTAIGLGLRARTPVGLVRLDVAYPFDPLAGEKQEVKLYFGLGNVF